MTEIHRIVKCSNCGHPREVISITGEADYFRCLKCDAYNLQAYTIEKMPDSLNQLELNEIMKAAL